MTDFLDEKRQQITDRLAELQPAVDEHQRLQAAAAALDGIPDAPSGPSAPASPSTGGRRGPGRPRAWKTKTTATPATASPKPASTTAKPTAKRKRRRKRTGKRARQTLALIRANPGITIPAMANKMGINANYLYRIIPSLEQQGKIHKDGRGYHAIVT